MRILIAENDQMMATQLQQLLNDAHYEPVCVCDGSEALRQARDFPFGLLLLDAGMSGQSGLDITKELRRLQIQTPILMLSSFNTVDDKVAGLDSGADDYMTTPYADSELLARIRALTRRFGLAIPDHLQFGDLSFRANDVTLSCGDCSVRLNYKEAELMKLLLNSPQRILSKEELIRKVWGYASTTSDNNVEAYISFLRKKLVRIHSNVKIIAIKKQGYKLEYAG